MKKLKKKRYTPFFMDNFSRFGNFIDFLKFFIVVFVVIYFFLFGLSRLGYDWQWYRIPEYIFYSDENGFHSGILIKGLYMTLKITAVSLILAFIFGLFTALFRLSNSYALRACGRIYVELIRNTPLLIQLFLIYFVIAPMLGMGAFWSAVIALSLFEGAYASEILRSGIVNIDRGQWEASASLGLSEIQTYKKIILPQAIKRIIPPLTSQAISLVKDSALVSTIALYDLTMQGRALIANTFLTFEVWFTVAGIYLVVTLTLSVFVSYLEKKFGNTANGR